MWNFSTAHTPSCSHHCTVKLEKPPLHPKFHLSVIPSDPSVSTATDLPHTLTAKPSGAPFNPDTSVIPQETQPRLFRKKPCSEQSPAAGRDLWWETLHKAVCGSKQKRRIWVSRSPGMLVQEKLQQLPLPAQIPSHKRAPRPGTRSPRMWGEFPDPLTPTHLPKGSAPAPAPEMVKQTLQLCPVREGRAGPAARTAHRRILPLPLIPTPHSSCSLLLPWGLNDSLRDKTQLCCSV